MRRWLKRWLPDPRPLSKQPSLRIFGGLLRDPGLWCLNRRSISGAFALGLFVMYLPPLGQTFIAAAGAIKLRVNLPISVSLVWLSNPITIPPMFYFAYLVGCWTIGRPVRPFDVHFWMDWHNWLGVIGPVLLGSLLCASGCALLGYLAIEGLWRLSLARQIRLRRARYASLSALSTPSSSRQI